MKLKELAHSRTGDKGNIVNISVIVYDIQNYETVKEQVTVERVKEWFKDIVKGDVTRYEIECMGALNFVMTDALGGGVTRSLALDMHGKSLGAALLDLDLEVKELKFYQNFDNRSIRDRAVIY